MNDGDMLQREDTKPSEGFVGKTEIAKRLGKTVRTVDSWMRDGRVPFIKLGRSVLFRWSDVERHIVTHYQVLRFDQPRARCTRKVRTTARKVRQDSACPGAEATVA